MHYEVATLYRILTLALKMINMAIFNSISSVAKNTGIAIPNRVVLYYKVESGRYGAIMQR